MWFSAFCFYFEGHFISKKMWKDENAKSWRWSWWIYLNTSILWCGFFCMHTWIENDVHRLYTSFSRQRPFFILEEKRFCNFGLPHLWILILRVTWVDSLTFLYRPVSLHLSLIPQLFTSWLVTSARPWIWCHFNIGLILVVQIKSYEQFVWVWHQYLPIALLFWIQTHNFQAYAVSYWSLWTGFPLFKHFSSFTVSDKSWQQIMTFEYWYTKWSKAVSMQNVDTGRCQYSWAFAKLHEVATFKVNQQVVQVPGAMKPQ